MTRKGSSTLPSDKAALKKVNLRKPSHFLALGFGSGLAPFMPGTFGTIVALPLVFALSFFPVWFYLAVTALTILAGIWICDVTAKDLGVHDHSAIVWDEIAGMLITMALIPFTWLNLLVGFVLFRLFDIIKPWPISLLDKKVHGGLGIMLDDVVAGLFSLFTLHFLLFYQLI